MIYKKKNITISGLLLLLLFSYSYGETNPFEFQNTNPKANNSKFWKALGLSILIPGAGELYLGETKTAIGFMTVEGLTWASALAFKTQGDWIKENYISYAVSHASINTNNKDDEFYKNLAFYPNRDQYNFEKLLYYEDFSLLYPETEEYYWNWDSEQNMEYYHSLRTRSESSYRNVSIAIGVAGVNRLLSALDIVRIRFLSSRYKGFTLRLTPSDNNNSDVGLMLSYKKNF